MKILIAGGTGSIGRALRQSLAQAGHELTVLTRHPKGRGELYWDGMSLGAWQPALEEAEAVVNLAGENVAGKRWTVSRKQELRDSRILSTRALVAGLKAVRDSKVLINASAVGYYGDRGEEELPETAAPGRDFLAQLCVDWEREAAAAESLGTRVVRLRLGVVLAKDGGALEKIAPPFKLFGGGPIGSGSQWMSWIHRDDAVGLIQHLLKSRVSGPVNATTPAPVTNRDFSAALGRALHRPSWVKVPPLALRVALGEMAEMLLGGQRVIPSVAQKSGYRFLYPDIDSALKACFP